MISISTSVEHVLTFWFLSQPDNIGFDVRGDVKLFDFGLAKELDDTMKTGYCSEFYELSGNTGSLRYMAPEVALAEPYNLTADVYSFGLLLWQVCSLDLPYDGMSRSDHSLYVVKGNERPDLDPTWSTPLRILMKRAWEPDPCLRPSMESTFKILKREIVALRDGDSSGLEFSKRRSTFVLNRDSAANPEQREPRRREGRSSFVSVNSHADNHGDRRGSLRALVKQVSNRAMSRHSITRLSKEEYQHPMKLPERTASSRALFGHLLERSPSKRGALAA